MTTANYHTNIELRLGVKSLVPLHLNITIKSLNVSEAI